MLSYFLFYGNEVNSTHMIHTSIALASSSPRRLELLRSLDLTVRVVSVSHEEVIDPSWLPAEVPTQLAIQKNRNALSHRKQKEVLVTADTIVLLGEEILHKPANNEEARRYLNRLSNTCHKVITGVCLSTDHEVSFTTTTKVWMSKLSPAAIEYYINKYQPLDKAGGYGIQEWIGWSHIHRIEGSYSNVMGLPTCEVFRFLETGF